MAQRPARSNDLPDVSRISLNPQMAMNNTKVKRSEVDFASQYMSFGQQPANVQYSNHNTSMQMKPSEIDDCCRCFSHPDTSDSRQPVSCSAPWFDSPSLDRLLR
eukprot:746889-Hanusia_phi.AAC.4